mmetsp:Transcript_11408/g.8365  ORF Transcript_11408/g.8365 Transcript_11408/m.8365 type:complete len:111 (+) Transcript_11408:310-642(+)
MREAEKEGYKKAGHDMNFKPAKDIHRKVKADFEHATDLKPVKKNYRDAEGAVIIEPRNFLTTGVKKGQFGRNVYLGEHIPYETDPYERKRELERKELQEHHSKMQEKPFS